MGRGSVGANKKDDYGEYNSETRNTCSFVQ